MMANVHARAQADHLSPQCLVTGVFDAGEERGMLCQIEFSATTRTHLLVAPIEHLSFGREDPVALEIVGRLMRRSKRRRKEPRR